MLKYTSKFTIRSCPRWPRPSSGLTSSITTSSPSPARRPLSPRPYRPPSPRQTLPAKTTPEAKPADAAGDVANLPEAGVKAKGISEKALLEKNAAAEKAVVEKPADKVTDKTADKPAETASIPAEPRRHTPAPREKTAVRVIPLTGPAGRAGSRRRCAGCHAAGRSRGAPEERRDANDLARAAIDRLRGGDESPRQKEAARPRTPDRTPRNEISRNPEAARVPEAPRVTTEPACGRCRPRSWYRRRLPRPTNARVDDPQRPTPPAEIPTMRPPLDLRAEMAEPKREKTFHGRRRAVGDKVGFPLRSAEVVRILI